MNFETLFLLGTSSVFLLFALNVALWWGLILKFARRPRLEKHSKLALTWLLQLTLTGMIAAFILNGYFGLFAALFLPLAPLQFAWALQYAPEFLLPIFHLLCAIFALSFLVALIQPLPFFRKAAPAIASIICLVVLLPLVERHSARAMCRAASDYQISQLYRTDFLTSLSFDGRYFNDQVHGAIQPGAAPQFWSYRQNSFLAFEDSDWPAPDPNFNCETMQFWPKG